jgi:RNA-directed DNA polymerase
MWPSPVRSFLDPLRGIVKRHQPALPGNVILQWPPGMRGWAPYHQHGASTRPVAQGAPPVFPLRWQWARRSPPRQSRQGMRDTYLRTEDGHTWVCVGHVTRPNGTHQDVRLFRAARVPMRRHTTSKGAAHPYAPPWAPDCAARLGVRRAHTLRGRRHLLRRWKEQDGRCAVCRQRLPPCTGWPSHPLVWRTHGGSDRTATRVLLHPHGHAQVHSHGWTVVTPRPSQGVGKA